MIQTQVINLVIGVVTRSLAATDATSDRVGACGAKLHERVQNEHQWQAGLQLPFRFAFNPPRLPPRRKRLFLPRKGPPAGGWFANHALQPL